MRDPLSEVLRAVRLTGAVFFSIDASTPWVAEAPDASSIARFIMPNAEHVIEYHLVTKGSCWAGLVEGPHVQLQAGDVIAFPQGDRHVLSSAPGARGEPVIEPYRSLHEQRLPVPISIRGGGKDEVSVICGFFGCDAKPFNPLLSTLPRMIHLRGSNENDSALRKLVELAVAETSAPGPGSDCVLSRLSELLFVELVRRHVATLPPGQVGFLAGLQDPNVGRALQQIHQRPAHAWSLEELAKEAGVSRSTLAERFGQLMGMAPIQYLAQWRIQLAAALLRTSNCSLAEIAQQVGYGTEFALSRAFKREVGLSPASYRRTNMESESTQS
ncbi:MAG: AraC family transcriptional regulator [Myxococcales bacterium]